MSRRYIFIAFKEDFTSADPSCRAKRSRTVLACSRLIVFPRPWKFFSSARLGEGPPAPREDENYPNIERVDLYRIIGNQCRRRCGWSSCNWNGAKSDSGSPLARERTRIRCEIRFTMRLLILM